MKKKTDVRAGATTTPERPIRSDAVPPSTPSAPSERAASRETAPEQPLSPSEEEQRSPVLSGISLEVRVELGRTKMPLRDAIRLASGSIVDFEQLVDEPVDLYVNDLLVARGEIIVVNESFCVRITEVTPDAAEVSS